jgi:hypothetical protein
MDRNGELQSERNSQPCRALLPRLRPTNHFPIRQISNREAKDSRYSSGHSHILNSLVHLFKQLPGASFSIFSLIRSTTGCFEISNNVSKDLQRSHTDVILVRHINTSSSACPFSIMARPSPFHSFACHDRSSTTILY